MRSDRVAGVVPFPHAPREDRIGEMPSRHSPAPCYTSIMHPRDLLLPASFVSVLLLSVPGLSSANQLSWSPNPGSSSEPLTISFSGTTICPSLVGFEVLDDVIEMRVSLGCAIGIPPPPEDFVLEIVVPPLEPGTYTVRVVNLFPFPPTVVATAQLDVVNPARGEVLVFLDPPTPNDNDALRVVATGSLGCADPTVESIDVDRSARTVEIHGTAPGGFSCIVAVDFAMIADVGPLDPGPWTVEIHIAEIVDDAEIPLFETAREVDVEDAPDVVRLQDRFDVSIEWRDFAGEVGPGRPVPDRSFPAESALFSFFERTNREVLVKVLDGCPINAHWWVLAAAATNVETDLRIVDTTNGFEKTYHNPLGDLSPALVDVEAFPCP